MAELLLELFSEEIPARMQSRAAKDLQRLVTEALKAAGLNFDDARAFATPRRLALGVTGLTEHSPELREERKGPRVGAPEKAVRGFLKAAGLTGLEQVEIVSDEKKGDYYLAAIERPGRAAGEVIAEIVPEIVAKFPWPKSMRWRSGSLRWVRPLHSVLCVLDGAAVPFQIDGIESGAVTFGHRFMAPGPISVSGIEDYLGKLKSAFVVLDTHARRQIILEHGRRTADAHGFELVEDEALLAENAGLAEWPVVLMGAFDEAFLQVPAEVLTTSMKAHQKCFSLRDPKTGALANRFMLVSNLVAEDGGGSIIEGNERVIDARLSDAKFFWEQDRKHSLESRLPKLNDIIFHAKLGSMHDKSHAVARLAMDLSEAVPGADKRECEQAAILAKADLVTEMVGEFPEWQGVMGRYYALNDGLSDDVADAIAAHYAPLGPSDAVPDQPTAIVAALADKLYGLVGFFGIDERPTGSRDPYALRRAALGVIRIVLENDLRLSLLPWFERTSQVYRDIGENVVAEHWTGDYDVGEELLGFFADRLKVYLRDRGARHDLIDAVFALGDHDDLLMIVKRVEALGSFLESDDGANLLIGAKRAQNILRIEEKKDKRSYDGAPDANLLKDEQEKALSKAIGEVAKAAELAIRGEDFEAAMAAMAKLRAPVDGFFDHVTVNADDPKLRENRLKLLAQIRATTLKVADFSRVEG